MMGVVDIMLLAGSISVLGVELSSSGVSHTVFSPRSHPTPYIVGLMPKSNPTVLAHAIPQRVRDNAPSGAAIILMQQSKTGVESLGHICRAFGGLFGDVKSAGSWGLPGFYAAVWSSGSVFDRP
jgi:polynucleotide 5'-hydroxyl-kinase GRC3/NOL9